jgi:hypothetical protein
VAIFFKAVGATFIPRAFGLNPAKQAPHSSSQKVAGVKLGKQKAKVSILAIFFQLVVGITFMSRAFGLTPAKQAPHSSSQKVALATGRS